MAGRPTVDPRGPTEPLGVRVHPDVKAEMRSRAAALGMPWQGLVRSILDRWLEGGAGHRAVDIGAGAFRCSRCGVAGAKDLLRAVPCEGAK